MLISYAHQFIFVHIDRTAGTSIQDALAPDRQRASDEAWRRRLIWLGGANAVGGLYRSIQFREHVTAATVKRCLPPNVYAGMLKFAFVRNPWDRLVSRYSYLLRKQEHPRHRLVSQMATFEDYLRWEIRRGKMHQHSYVTDASGRLIVDYIGRFEHLQTDVAEVCRQLGLPVQLPHTNVSSHQDYRSYYSRQTRDWVAREFQRDVELFGYTFDGACGATPLIVSREDRDWGNRPRGLGQAA
ncbi:MAG: sulfotransferase family 2 domain-containing protein [Porticoccaceae bacterium]